jgi:hypothetical protein
MSTMQSQSAADLSCSVCNQILHDNEDSIQCSGVCDISVHPKCSGLKKSEQKILQEGSGLLWFCDHCRIVGTNVSSLLMSIKSALLNCQDQLIKQSLMIETQNATIASLKSELSLVKTTLSSTRSAEDAAITSLVKTTKKTTIPSFSSFFKQDKPDTLTREVSGKPENARNHKYTRPVLRNEDADEDNTHTLLERDKSPDAISPTHDVKHINHDDPKWETVKSRRRNAVNRNNQDTKNEKPTVLYGTGKAAPKSSTILGALRRKWLYVGRIIGNEVSENDVKDYLQNIDCHDEIIIKKLTTKGHNSAFSIGVPPKIFNDVFNPDIWPDSVCLREFNVRSFLEKKRHIQNNM